MKKPADPPVAGRAPQAETVTVEIKYKPSLPISQGQWDAIAKTLGVETDSDHVQAAYDAVRAYAGRRSAMAELPAGDHRVRDVETLMALARAMEGMNLNVRAALAREGIDFTWPAPDDTALAAQHAAETMARDIQPPKRGPKPKTSRAVVLCQLADIFTTATGKPARFSAVSTDKQDAGNPSGPFFRYLRAAVAPASDLAGLTDHALAQAAKRAIKE